MTLKYISSLVVLLILSTLAATFMPLASAQAQPIGWRDLNPMFTGSSPEDHSAQPLAPIERLLNVDGTLNLTTGFSGSIDVSGWAMRTDANGAPRFVRTNETNANARPLSPNASPDDVNWDGRFDLPGANNTVFALAVSGSNLYVGGTFTMIGTVNVNHIASWDVKSGGWTPLANGVDGNVTALAVSGSILYVGGIFTRVCGNVTCSSDNLTVNNIAQWNGSSWSALGSGVNSNVTALAVSGSSLYVGGLFTLASGLIVNHLAHWNGSSWSALGSGVNDSVNALAVSGSNLFVGGVFTQACGNTACSSGNLTVNHIAQWNGSNWSALGNGVNDHVTVLAVNGSNLYAGGTFNEACGNVACSVGNLTINRIAQWNGISWSALANGLDNNVTALMVSGSSLYVGGFFSRACDNAACNSGSLAASHIAQWNGSIWSTLGDGLNGFVKALAVNGNNLYVGGSFSTAGGLTVNNIAQWNGSNWSALGHGVNGDVQALAVSGNNLYVGGTFGAVCGNVACNSGNLTVNRIAQWNGNNWSALGSGVDNPVDALAVSGNNLYVGGAFLQACGNAACDSGNLIVNNIALWNGSDWSALNHGVNGAVLALAVNGDDLYVGGIFSRACGNAACNSGNLTVNNIAQWNGTASAWSALSNGVNSFGVQALAASGNNLYVGGTFTQACGNAACYSGNLTVNNLAQWNGTASAWSALGSGLDNAVWALAVSESNLYLAGNFSAAGGKPSHLFGRWSKPFAVYVPIVIR